MPALFTTHVGRSERGLNFVAKAGDLALRPHIAGRVQAPASFLGREIVEETACVGAAGAASHARPGPREKRRDGAANAARGTGHDRQASVQLAHARRSSSDVRGGEQARLQIGRSRMSPTNALVSTQDLSWRSPGRARQSCSASITQPAPRAPRPCHRACGDLVGGALLQGQALGEAFDQIREAAEPGQLARRDVGQVRDPAERHQMVRAHGMKAQSADDDHVGIGLAHHQVAQDLGRIHGVAGEELLLPQLGHALGRLLQVRIVGRIQARGP